MQLCKVCNYQKRVKQLLRQETKQTMTFKQADNYSLR